MIRWVLVVLCWMHGSIFVGQTQLADYPLGPVGKRFVME